MHWTVKSSQSTHPVSGGKRLAQLYPASATETLCDSRFTGFIACRFTKSFMAGVNSSFETRPFTACTNRRYFRAIFRVLMLMDIWPN